MVNSFIITINFYNGKNMNCALTFIISNHNGRFVLRYLIKLDKCNDIFKVISDIMAQWYLMEKAIIITINLNCALMFIIRNHCGRIVLTSIIQLQ